ncbi:aconitate hydratase AcnA [Anaerocolumna sedimenticola]|uniref:Aconitate hydratase n=1 Tax=Anaerocolumna sedimenticola TaxID=2696063 RepID=A0A6P1TID2_9FIRM|nr:aconitate hydratase AcnA [Anaerocolumna sedimenticola]QHQ60970.1 aconitate hydratase AcnA [Anaerocolumna sedimenticola]
MEWMNKDKYLQSFDYAGHTYYYYNIAALMKESYDINRLPYSIRILLEAVLRQYDNSVITREHINALVNWTKTDKEAEEIPFKPSRVILQDFTGVPAIVDLASMREAIVRFSQELKEENNHKTAERPVDMELMNQINPEISVDLVIDHSVQVDFYGSPGSLEKNMKLEFERNLERYEFLNWASKAFYNLKVVPPATGIIHQVNLEYLAQVVMKKTDGGKTLLYPDTLVGTDSHTTMINALGILGWGVGGIEAEAAMLGQPSFFSVPEVIGVRFTGRLSEGITATDLALQVTKLLRQRGVVNKFIEFFGEGIKHLSLADRATIANMAPEYGATCGFFPVDGETLKYLLLTGRTEEQTQLIKAYFVNNQMFYHEGEQEPSYNEIIEIDLSHVKPGLSGPKRPQDLIPLDKMKEEFLNSLSLPLGNRGLGLGEEERKKQVRFRLQDGGDAVLKTGSLVIASITSCTNTSNPYVMFGAGLLAKKAVRKGLSVPPHVKTSFAPGSRVVSDYLSNSGLQEYLDRLRFHVVGYGCATCIGNSGPLLPEIEDAIRKNNLLVTSILSGNRNFEGRIHPLVKANYLASPILVVAYALAGTMNIDLVNEPIGTDQKNQPVYLKDIWPSSQEIHAAMGEHVKAELFQKEYEKVYGSNVMWNSIKADAGPLYPFKDSSTYIQNPAYFQNISHSSREITELKNLRIVGLFGDSITTDHISPAGAIGKDTPAGHYLTEHGVGYKDFNTYGARRGNHEVMMRGTFANIRIRNKLAPETEGGYTMYWPTKEVKTIYEACMKYQEDNTGLVVIAGKDYGMGSSRDWAAKGPSLLGIKTVIAESFERIHRSNLVMMGILPLQFMEKESAQTLGLNGEEIITIHLTDKVKPNDIITVTAKSDGRMIDFKVKVRFDSKIDLEYYRNGGILPMVLRKKLKII